MVKPGKGQPAAQPQALGPAFQGEGRRGRARAGKDGQVTNGAAEPVCRSSRRQSGGPETRYGLARRLPREHASGVTGGQKQAINQIRSIQDHFYYNDRMYQILCQLV